MSRARRSRDFLKGYIGKDLVKSLLEASDYRVWNYSYEDTWLDAKSKQASENSDTGRRLRKSPDLLVYDDQNIFLVEVKTRTNIRPYIHSQEINDLKEFWNDSIFVLVAPTEDVFYVRKTKEFEIEPPESYIYFDLSKFSKFQDFFPKVSDEMITHHREIALALLKVL